MKEIYLSGKRAVGKYALVDDEDYQFLNQWNWFLDTTDYAARDEKTKRFRMHAIIIQPPKGFEIDHINGDKLDNRKSNLRIATHAQNLFNRVKSVNKSSMYKGVRRRTDRNRWMAMIEHNSKRYHLGDFLTEHHAAMAYDIAAISLFGEFARLNFPEAIHG